MYDTKSISTLYYIPVQARTDTYHHIEHCKTTNPVFKTLVQPFPIKLRFDITTPDTNQGLKYRSKTRPARTGQYWTEPEALTGEPCTLAPPLILVLLPLPLRSETHPHSGLQYHGSSAPPPSSICSALMLVCVPSPCSDWYKSVVPPWTGF